MVLFTLSFSFPWRLKPVYTKFIGIKSPLEKELFGVEYSLELDAYKEACEVMNASKLSDESLPTTEILNSNIAEAEEKIAECTEKRKLIEKELHNLSLLKENIDLMIDDDLEEDKEEIEVETRSRNRYSQ